MKDKVAELIRKSCSSFVTGITTRDEVICRLADEIETVYREQDAFNDLRVAKNKCEEGNNLTGGEMCSKWWKAHDHICHEPELLATLIVNFGKNGNCVAGIITGDENPTLMLRKVLEYQYNKIKQLVDALEWACAHCSIPVAVARTCLNCPIKKALGGEK